MSDARTGSALRRSSLHLLAASGVGAVLGYAFWFLLARTTSSEVVGASGAAVSLATIVSLMSAAGVAPTVLAVIGADRTYGGRIVGRALAVVAGAGSLIALPVLLVVGTVGAFDVGVVGGVAFVLAAGAGGAAAVFDAAAIGAGHSGVVLARTVALGAIRLVGVFALSAWWTFTLDAALVVWALSALCAVAVSGLALRRCSVPMGFARLAGQGFVRRAGWNQIVTATAQLPGYVLPVVVTVAVSAEANAGFYLAWQVAGGCFMVAAATTPALLAQASGRDDATIDERTRHTWRLTAGLLVLAVLAVAGVGPVVLSMLGEDYASANWVLWTFALAAFPDAYTSVSVARWRAQHAERRAAMLNAAMGVTTVGGAVVLVPTIGATGAAVAFLVAQSLGSLYCVLDRRRDHSRVAGGVLRHVA